MSNIIQVSLPSHPTPTTRVSTYAKVGDKSPTEQYTVALSIVSNVYSYGSVASNRL